MSTTWLLAPDRSLGSSLVLAAGTACLISAGALAQTTVCASVGPGGAHGNALSEHGRISRDGRYVVFHSNATNLGIADRNGATDIYRKDLQTGAVVLVSRSFTGGAADGASFDPVVSADGNFVAFSSDATNLVSGDTNANSDIFLRDIAAGTTTLISHTFGGSASGSGFSFFPSITPDGRYVGFYSGAPDLVASDTNGKNDAFLFDASTGAIELISVSSSGAQGNDHTSEIVDVGPAISDDGRFVAFVSPAGNLVVPDNSPIFEDVFLRDRLRGTTTRVSESAGGVGGNFESISASISADGRWVAFYSSADNLIPNDTNSKPDVFVKDTVTGAVDRVSVHTGGGQGAGGAFGLSPVDRTSISADGRYVGFGSAMGNLVSGDTNGKSDVFRHDRWLVVTERLSVDSSGIQGNSYSKGADLSGDGRVVKFESDSSNLVAGDTNGVYDEFVRTLPEPYSAFCFGDGTAGTSACPCGNVGSNRHGCENSSRTSGGELFAAGDASVAGDSITLHVGRVRPSSPTTFVQSTSQASGGGRVVGNGISCLSGTMVRLGTHDSDAKGLASFGSGVPGDPLVSVKGSVPAAGATRYYQAEYRDGIGFCTGSSFNVSSGIVIVWSP